MVLATLAIGGIGLYAAAVGSLYVLQDRLIFPRHGLFAPNDPLPPGTEELRLEREDGVELFGFRVPAGSGYARGTVVGFGGNRWHAEDFVGFLSESLPDYDLIVFHYRGYGPSEGVPSEAALVTDAMAIVDTYTNNPEAPVIAAGFSIGSGVAMQLAARRDLTGVLLVTPFDSLRAIAANRYPWAPVRLLLKHPFASDRVAPGLIAPIAVVYAEADLVVPPERTRALLPTIPHLVHVEEVPGAGHSSLYDLPEIGAKLQSALDALLQARTDG